MKAPDKILPPDLAEKINQLNGKTKFYSSRVLVTMEEYRKFFMRPIASCMSNKQHKRSIWGKVARDKGVNPGIWYFYAPDIWIIAVSLTDKHDVGRFTVIKHNGQYFVGSFYMLINKKLHNGKISQYGYLREFLALDGVFKIFDPYVISAVKFEFEIPSLYYRGKRLCPVPYSDIARNGIGIYYNAVTKTFIFTTKVTNIIAKGKLTQFLTTSPENVNKPFHFIGSCYSLNGWIDSRFSLYKSRYSRYHPILVSQPEAQMVAR